jgi:hypothetical protein
MKLMVFGFNDKFYICLKRPEYFQYGGNGHVPGAALQF